MPSVRDSWKTVFWGIFTQSAMQWKKAESAAAEDMLPEETDSNPLSFFTTGFSCTTATELSLLHFSRNQQEKDDPLVRNSTKTFHKVVRESDLE